MGNYLDYLSWRGDLSFDAAPLNEVDYAVLAEMSYFPYDLLDIPTHSTNRMEETLKALLQVPGMENHIKSETDIRLMEALSVSERFCHLPILEFRNICDESHVVQFSVITIRLKEDLYYVSFRGTDGTLLGWQEDFNMGVAFPVPSQKLAVIYVNTLAEKVNGNFILGGHSKGGNLAIYASSFCENDVQDRVLAAYNFDGPGFDSWIMSQPQYLEVEDRITTIVPQSSIIGMLLEQTEGFEVVHSTESGGFAQHELITWEVERDHFIKLESVTNKSLFLDAAITGWIHSMNYEQRKAFVDALFCIFKDADVRSVGSISLKKVGQMLSMVKSYVGMDQEVRSHIVSTIMALVRCVREEAPAYGMEGLRLFRRKESKREENQVG